jgi:hypothetical protein
MRFERFKYILEHLCSVVPAPGYLLYKNSPHHTGDPNGGVGYLRIVLSTEEASPMYNYIYFGKRLSRKCNNVVVFHSLSTSQYSSRSNHSSHACCYTILNHLKHDLLYWWRCFRHKRNFYRSFLLLDISLRMVPTLWTCPAWETLLVAMLLPV